MRGFFKNVSSEIRSNMPSAGQEAAKTFKGAFDKAASDTGKGAVNQITDTLGKSIPRLRNEAAAAGKALSAATDEAARSAGALIAAREREESAATALAAAEKQLASARSSGSAERVSRAERAHEAALKASAAANKEADSAAASHSRALGKVEQATREADAATDALKAATDASAREARESATGLRGLIARLRETASAADDVEDSTRGMGKGLSGISLSLRSMVGPAVGLAAVIGVGGFAGEVIAASDATDKFKSTLNFAGLDAGVIDKLTQSTKAYADATVYDLADIQSITAQLAANGVADYDRLAEAAGNLNAVAGGTAETYGSVGMVLTQTAGQGKLTTENWNQLADAIPGASGKLQEALLQAGAYTGNFREAMEKGEISAEEFNAAILSLGFEEAAVEAARSTSTIEGAAGNLQATIVSGFQGLLDEIKPSVTGLLGWLSEAIGAGFDWIPEHTDEIKAMAAAIATAAVAWGAFSILTSVRAWLDGLTLSQKLLNLAMKANPVGIIITLIAALVGGLVLLYNKNEDFRLKVQELGKTVVAVWQEHIWPAISTVWDWVTGTLIPGFQSVWNILANGDFDGNLFGLEEDSGFVDFLFTVRDAAIAVWDWISGTLIPGIQSVWNILANGDFDGNLFGLEEDSGFVDFLFTVRDAAIQVWDWVSGTLIPGVQSFWNDVLSPIITTVGAAVVEAWTQYIWPALQAAWSWVSGTLIPGVQSFWNDVLSPIITTVGAAVVEAWTQYIWPALQAAWSWISGTLIPGVQAFWAANIKPVVDQVVRIIVEAWTQYIWPALQAAWSWISGTLIPLVQQVWREYVQPIVSAIGTLIKATWESIIAPTLSALWAFITGVLAPVIQWLWNNIVGPSFRAMGALIGWTWDYAIKPALSALWAFITNFVAPTISWLWNNIVSPAFSGIKTIITTAVNFLVETVFPKIKSTIETIGNGFTTFKETATKAFNAVKAAAAKPINFVIRTVYTSGIKKAFDTIAEKVGLSLRLPSVSAIPGYASGGQWKTMTPGYTPGKDIYTFYSPDGGGALRLSGGEGIIRPDSLRALGGKRWLDAVNASRGRGLANVGDVGRGAVAFAEGGIWGRLKEGFDSAVAWVGSTAEAVGEIFSDPIGAITNLVAKPANALLATMGGDFWSQTIKTLPGKWLSSIKEWFKKGTETAGGAAGGPATGLVGAARKAIGVPYVWGGSSIPPGLDCSGLVYWAARQLGWGWPRLTAAGYQSAAQPVSGRAPGDLLFWGHPAWHVAIASTPGRMVESPRPGLSVRETAIWGSPTVGRYGARKYDSGGVLPPGVTAAVNLTRRPEAILTGPQWDSVSRLADRGADLATALDGLELALRLDNGEQLDAHIEVVADTVARRRARLAGRGR
nr:tape measure protein [Actinomyces bowdenii]